MSKRLDILGGFYAQFDEDSRVLTSRQGQLEYRTTMEYIRRHAPAGGKLLFLLLRHSSEHHHRFTRHRFTAGQRFIESRQFLTGYPIPAGDIPQALPRLHKIQRHAL